MKSSATRQLPGHADLEPLGRQANELLEGFLNGDPDAIAEVPRFSRDAGRASFALHQAQVAPAGGRPIEAAGAGDADADPPAWAAKEGHSRIAAMLRAKGVSQ